MTQALSVSSLAWEFDHLSGTTDDAYAFTHAILYATDHGRNAVDLPRPFEQIKADAEAILAVALDAGNHDLTAEVLWTWPMLGLDWSPLAAEAHGFLTGIAESEGFLPGPGFDRTVCDELPKEQRDLYVLQTSYHTTLVHGMLIAAIQNRDLRAAAAVRNTELSTAPVGQIPIVPCAAERFAPILSPHPVSQRWWDHVSGLSPERRDVLSAALATMSLRRAVSTADIGAVHQTLLIAEECGLPMAPVIRQGHLLLNRAVRCAQLAG